MKSKSISIDFGSSENLTIIETSDGRIELRLKSLETYSIPKKEFFDGIRKFEELIEFTKPLVKKGQFPENVLDIFNPK